MAVDDQPMTYITDYLIAAECILFIVVLCIKLNKKKYVKLHTGFKLSTISNFAAASVYATLGGLVHHFFTEEDSTTYNVLWRLVCSLTGISAWAQLYWSYAIFVALPKQSRQSRWLDFVVQAFLVSTYLVFCGVILYDPVFFSVIVYYGISVVLFLVALVMLIIRLDNTSVPRKHLVYGLLGVAIFFVAAYIQSTKIAIAPSWFNHNAFAHIVQMFAFFLFYKCSSWLIFNFNPSMLLVSAKHD